MRQQKIESGAETMLGPRQKVGKYQSKYKLNRKLWKTVYFQLFKTDCPDLFTDGLPTWKKKVTLLTF